MSKQILGNVLRWSDARSDESLLVPVSGGRWILFGSVSSQMGNFMLPILLLAFSAVLNVVRAANDEIPANTFTDPQNQAAMEKIAEDVFAGMQLANVAIVMDGQKPLYCKVGGLKLDGSQIIDLTREVISLQPGWAKLPWGTSFMLGLQWKFPCQQDIPAAKPNIAPSIPSLESSLCPGKKIIIDPRLVPRRPKLTKENYVRLAITNKGTQMEKYWTDLYVHQNEPVQVPYGAGNVLIDANDACIQQYVGPN